MLVDDTGISIDDLTAILNRYEASLATILGEDFVIENSLVAGNIANANADEILIIQRQLLNIVTQMNPNTATGIWLDIILALNGLERLEAEKTTFTRTVTTTSSIAIGDLTIQKDGTTYQFVNTTALTSTGAMTFECLEYGAIAVNSGDTFTIITPIAGVTGISYTTGQTANLGRLRETDIEARLRRNASLSSNAKATKEAVISYLTPFADNGNLLVLNNRTDTTDGNGTPPHSYQIFIQGGTDAEIGQAIYEVISGTAGTYGTTTVNVLDSQGVVDPIKFSRGTEVPITIDVELLVASNNPTLEAEIQTAILNHVATLYGYGKDVYAYNFYCVLEDFEDKFIEVQSITVNSGAKVTIDFDELATFSSSSINVVQNT